MNAFRHALALGVLLAAWPPAPAQETTRVSVDSSGAEGNADSYPTSMSPDGRFIAFQSTADNLVPGDTNGAYDIFVRDRVSGVTERVSVDSSGVQADGDCYEPSISPDGRFVVFESFASNLIAGDSNGTRDIFIHDRQTGTTYRLSVDSNGAQADNESFSPVIAADGTCVVFVSLADNLVQGDGNATFDVFVRDLQAMATERVNVDSSGAEANDWSLGPPAISSDGRFVLFSSRATNLVPGDTNGTWDSFVHDRQLATTTRVSVDSSGSEGDGPSYGSSMSSDGRFVAFYSEADNLVPGDLNGIRDVFVHDLVLGATECMSVDSAGVFGDGPSEEPSISSDGRFVSFTSSADNLVAGDTNNDYDIFFRDRQGDRPERVSTDSSGIEGNSGSFNPCVSADGLNIAFSSRASNLVAGDTNGASDVFVHERCTIDASWSNYGAGFPGTNGTPTLTSQEDPVFGSTVTLDLSNSYGHFTAAVLFVGFQQTSFHTHLGGDVLLAPAVTLLVALPPNGISFTGDIPDDQQLCGFEIDVQAIEADPGATKGVSFTQGLELILGH